MKLLTIITSRDMEGEIEDLLSKAETDCYVKMPEAYGINHRCQGMIGDSLPWDATVLMVAGEQEKLERLAGDIKRIGTSKTYKPCLRMMLSPVDKVWM
ncbi:MAG: hypothetical protein U9P14_00115 [Gemmatimonadota bacterium]|nr:hypothetical protein [Gemmatimonadota bacterium]